jgi:putative ABC transport system permease protein
VLPVATAMRLFGQKGLHRIMVQARTPADVPAALEHVRKVVRERHRDEDFTLITQDAMLAGFRRIIDALTIALACIAAISLAVAGIGIMNVMLVSVSERVGEIGLLKALGAPPRRITAMFLAEALLLAGAGALAGLGVGAVVLAGAGAALPALALRPGPGWAAAILVMALAVGALFGWIPARRAAAWPAADALRGRR